jgi:hypothetical protein
VQGREGGVHGRLVAPHHLGTTATVGLADRGLDPGDGLVGGQDARDREEAGLEHGVGPAGQPRAAGHGRGVHGIQAQPLVDDPLLDRPGDGVPHLVGRLGRVEQQGGPLLRAGQDVDGLEQPEVVAADEAGPAHEVRSVDGVRAEAQVRDGEPAGLLGVVDEVGLGVHLGVGAEDLDGVLVGPDRAVRAQPVEDGPQRLRVLDVEIGVVGQARAADVVGDAQGEPAPRRVECELGEHARRHARRELLGRQPVPPADDPGDAVSLTARAGLGQGGEDVEVERLPVGAGLLGAVEDRHRAHAVRQRLDQLRRREGAVQAHLEHPDPVAAGDEVGHCLAHRLRGGAHDDDDPLGLGVAVVLDDPVRAPGVAGDLVHDVLHDRGRAGVERVHGLARLEVHVGVLRRPPHERVLGRQGAGPVLAHEGLGDHRAEHLVVDELDGVQLVGGPEAVEEVDERDARAQRGGLGDERQVVGLLHRRRRQEGEPRLPHRHDVRVVAEDRQPLGGQRPGRDVEHRRGQLTGDLVHVGDHE